jgi:hypothetical protein
MRSILEVTSKLASAAMVRAPSLAKKAVCSTTRLRYP